MKRVGYSLLPMLGVASLAFAAPAAGAQSLAARMNVPRFIGGYGNVSPGGGYFSPGVLNADAVAMGARFANGIVPGGNFFTGGTFANPGMDGGNIRSAPGRPQPPAGSYMADAIRSRPGMNPPPGSYTASSFGGYPPMHFVVGSSPVYAPFVRPGLSGTFANPAIDRRAR